MKKIFAVMFAMLFAASTGVYAAKHLAGEMKDAKAAPAKDDAKKGDAKKDDAKKGDAKKDEKAKK